jgi:SAM-dependent methyltransferase
MEKTVNSDMRAGWNGESGANWVERQAQFDGMLVPWGALVAETAAVAAGERVLDVGCGNGATTRAAAVAAGAGGQAVGVDLSEPMLDLARTLAAEEGVENVRFVAGDAQVDELTSGGEPYDVVISRFGVMFFDDPVAAFANIGKAVRPGGRLAFVAWADLVLQDWLTVPAAAALAHLPPLAESNADSPMLRFADIAYVTDVLTQAGWSDVEVATEERSIVVAGGGTAEDAADFLLDTGQGKTLVGDASPEQVKAAREAIIDTLQQHVTPRGVELRGVTRLVTARR